jgi:hypothetical protein
MTEELSKYRKVERLGKRGTEDILRGGYIVIQEKLDGANASFELKDGKLICYSRNTQLDECNTLRGFYNWVQENIDPEVIVEGYRFFGEWLVRHKLDYGSAENDFYLFDIRNESTMRYEPLHAVVAVAHALRCNLIPILYAGKALEFAEIEKRYVGKSVLAAAGEGVVVKNETGLYAKIVSDSFREMVKQPKARDPKTLPQESVFVSTFLTSARVEKMLHKLVDEGLLHENFGIEDMGTILKELSPRLKDDMLEEEGEALEGHDEKALSRSIGRVLPVYVKEILRGRS